VSRRTAFRKDHAPVLQHQWLGKILGSGDLGRNNVAIPHVLWLFRQFNKELRIVVEGSAAGEHDGGVRTADGDGTLLVIRKSRRSGIAPEFLSRISRLINYRQKRVEAVKAAKV